MSSAFLDLRSTARPASPVELFSTVAEIAPQPRRLGWRRRLAWGMVATDAAAIAVAVFTAQFLRFGDPVRSAGGWTADAAYALTSLALIVVWLVSLAATRSRLLRNIGTGMVEYQRVLQSTLFTFGAFAVVAYLLQLQTARGYLAIALPLGLVLLIVARGAWRTYLHALRRVGRCMTGAIVVGGREDVLRVLSQLRSHYRIGYRAIAVSMPGQPGATAQEAESTAEVLPFIPLEDVARVSKHRRARAVIVAGSLPGGNDAIRRLGWDLENSQVELILMSRLTDVAGPRIHMRPINGLPMVHVDLPNYSGYSHAVKRIFDVSIVTVALVLLSPVFAAIAVAVRLDSEGPVIFRQERVGAHGTRFTMLKFRSMVVDAEARLGQLRALDEGNGVLFKMKDDPRVTRVGRFLRAYSLDELPQLWNVLRGDMSLVGPRPPLPSEVEQYQGPVSRRLLTRPGITGLWQVNGRSNLSWEDSVRLDLYYVENWSITGDIVVLAKTVKAVLHSDGAY
ncbi:sugar transferase [Microbacterium trichothecenolyticum]|uniref:sugar transferase n=1 Tax=Microbacterium trichothecenolyticum TaxID=69370 RepID=UPI0035BEA13F